MKLWTEIKCYNCSRVCGEAPDRGEYLGRLHQAGQLSPGPFCTLAEGDLRCNRCGGLVYPGETYSDYVPQHREKLVVHSR